MIICKTKIEIRNVLSEWRGKNETICAVPTMGALHDGHLSLVRSAANHCDRTVATIFVNPLQFGPNEDFDVYPRAFDEDVKKLEELGCDLLFAPGHNSLFSEDFSTTITVGGVGENHCALTRPQFFNGVATIVAKLLMILTPDAAIFGEKDFQQLTVIRRMVRDLDFNVRIIGSPTVREADGLAMSSRNRYLTPEERKAAPALYRAISAAAEDINMPGALWVNIRDAAIGQLTQAGFSKVDYMNYVDAHSLEPYQNEVSPGRILAAAWLGRTRLIDNVPVRAQAAYS